MRPNFKNKQSEHFEMKHKISNFEEQVESGIFGRVLH